MGGALRSPSRELLRAAVLALLCVAVAPLHADCAKDSMGEVFCGAGSCLRDKNGTIWCSRFDDGGVRTTRHGQVVCGRGDCAKTFNGSVFCSTVPGGTVVKDRNGRVRCEGRCEPASAENCESTRADSAG